MKKSLLLIPLLFIGSFAIATEDFPSFPMTIYGNIKIWSTDLKWWTLKLYNSSNKELTSYSITQEWKYWSDNVSILPLLLNKFDWNLTFKVSYNWKTYVADSIDDSNKWEWCPSKSAITFIQWNCRYDITLKEEPKQNQWWSTWWWGGGWGGSSNSNKDTWWSTTTLTNNTNTTTPKINEKESTNTDNKSIDSKIPTINNYEYNKWDQSEILENWYTREQNNAYNFAYANWITTIKGIQKANLSWPMTRAAMAKMLSKYAINVLWKDPDISRTPNFSDISKEINKQYNNWITLAYQLWIMWIWTKNFRPYDPVTRAEFATVLSRMLYNTLDWTWKAKYYEPHIAKLYSKWIITKTNPNIIEKRWYVMTMLMRSAK